MQGWTLRSAGPQDVELYRAAADRFFRDTYGHDAHHAKVMDQHCGDNFGAGIIAAQLSDPDVTALIAELGSATVGLAQWRIDGDAVELERIYVDRACHGTGLGKALLAAVAADATRRGKRSLYLGVWDRNERAIAFYRRQGFVVTGTVDFLLAGAAQTDLLMRRELAQDA
jgi:diamine N-acetyltransferase